ncbi:MAG: hypothetical protein KGJ05_07470 [Alphaproteobacteria bacterium]|nr:hypothetical protein [Alphaproteobacteria bacterium]MDE2339639.1 hypothetical protein [Alphaproteobacteria bacterium]
MKHQLKLLAGSGVAWAAMAGSPTLAAGTVAGTAINNTASVTYTVGGVTQPTVTSNTATFNVDRKIIVTALETDAAAVSVVPGQTNTVTKWSITNSSNDKIDINLAAAAIASGTTISIPGATTAATSFTVGAATFTYTETGGTTYLKTSGGVWLDSVPPDTTVTITVTDTTALPNTPTNGQYAGISLTAQARQNITAGTEGAVFSTSTASAGGLNNVAVNNVFAESATSYTGVTDPKWDGQYIAVDAYIVAAPVLSVLKTATVLWDPINGATSPKAIPGAQVRYCIQVANGAGAATAVSPTVSDTLPTQVTYVANSIYINGTFGAGVCNTGAEGSAPATGTGSSGSAGTAPSGGIASGTLSNLAGGSTETMYFDVTIN